MNRQIAIRPQDVVILLKIISFQKSHTAWLRKDQAEHLGLSNAEITNVFERLRNTGLMDIRMSDIQRN